MGDTFGHGVSAQTIILERQITSDSEYLTTWLSLDSLVSRSDDFLRIPTIK
jgi:hypothetical protein